MKVGILTFHASHNYGSMLQAYALQTTLSKLGIESRIINFRSDVQKRLILPPIELKHPRSSLIKLIKTPVKTLALCRKYKRFEKFLNNDLSVTEELTTAEEVTKHVSENKYDALLTGSDQIWNPACWDFSTVYLIDFPFNGKKIAYAPSLGSHPEKIIEAEKDTIISLAAKYDAISTRELRGKVFLKSRLNRNIQVTLDPTLLLVAKDYSEIASKKTLSTPYILYYTPREEKGFFIHALTLASKLKMKVVVTQDSKEYEGHDNIIFKLDCGPKEFLSLIKGASYCIGNSFHLLAFSLIFHKEFILLSNEQDSRMLNILEQLGLASRLHFHNRDINIEQPINYDMVDEILSNMAQDSTNYLNNAIYL